MLPSVQYKDACHSLVRKARKVSAFKMAAKEAKLHETDSEDDTTRREDSHGSGKSSAKKKKYLQRFKPSYSKDFPGLVASPKGEDFAFCRKCNVHFGIGHGGQHDIKRHIQTENHKSNASSSDGGRITQFFMAASPAEEEKKTCWNEYQCTDVSSCAEDRVDETWKKIGSLNDGQFLALSHVMRGILTIPHSNAHCERVFSCVRKNRTSQRASLGDSTVESLLILKSTPNDLVEDVQSFSETSLKKLKSAYASSLKQ